MEWGSSFEEVESRVLDCGQHFERDGEGETPVLSFHRSECRESSVYVRV